MAEALDEAVRTFSQITRTKLRVFRELITGRDNPEVVGSYVEEVVRGFLNSWIAPMRVCHGSLWYPSAKHHKIMQLDGLIWQPSFGPPIMQEGEFLLLHPNTVLGAVEIKHSANLQDLYKRLNDVADNFLVPTGHNKRDAMGIVVSHPKPATAAKAAWSMAEGQQVDLHDFSIHHCPIFILFDNSKDEYEPYLPGIRNLIALFNMIANSRRLNALI